MINQLKKYYKISIVAIFSMLVLPNITSAASTISDIEGLSKAILKVINSLVPVIIAITVLVIIWGIYLYVVKEAEEKEKGQKFAIYGIVGLFVMISIWGLVNILGGSFNLDNKAKDIDDLKIFDVT